MTTDNRIPRRRGDGPRNVRITVAIDSDTRKTIRRINAAEGVVVRGAIESGLLLQADLRRHRRQRAAELKDAEA